MLRKLCKIVAAVMFVGYSAVIVAGGYAYASTSHKLTAVRVIWQPGDEQPFYYANAKELWAKYGLKIHSIEVQQGTAELSAMASNSADIALFGSGPFVSGVGKGIDMVAVYPTVNFATLEGLYVNPKSGIKGLRGLVGRSVAVPFGSSADSGLRFGLEKKGIESSKIHVENIAPAEILAGYERGNIDAAYIWSTWGQRLLASGAKLVATDASDGVQAGPTVVAVRRTYLKHHPKVVAEFLAALDQGAIGSNRHPRVAAQALHDLTKVTLKEGLTIAKREHSIVLKEALSRNGPFSLVNGKTGLAHVFEKVGLQLKKEGLIDAVPKDFGKYVSAVPAKAAVSIVNK